MIPVYIKWNDAMSDIVGWRTIEDAIEWGHDVPCKVEQLGFIVDETEDYILLASKLNFDIIQGLTKIPKKYILERINLNYESNTNI